MTASHGVAVFDGLSIDQLGTGYTFTDQQRPFASVTTDTFDIIANPTPGSGTFYPVPTDASLRSAIATADSNGDASNTIVLEAATYVLTDTTAGQIVIQNSSSLPSKTLTIVGQGDGANGTIIQPGTSAWQDRIFEVVGTTGSDISVVFQDLAIEGGNATDGGILGGTAALGGGLLIDGGTVSLTHVAVQGDQADGAAGAAARGGKGAGAGHGGAGKPAPRRRHLPGGRDADPQGLHDQPRPGRGRGRRLGWGGGADGRPDQGLGRRQGRHGGLGVGRRPLRGRRHGQGVRRHDLGERGRRRRGRPGR